MPTPTSAARVALVTGVSSWGSGGGSRADPGGRRCTVAACARRVEKLDDLVEEISGVGRVRRRAGPST